MIVKCLLKILATLHFLFIPPFIKVKCYTFKINHTNASNIGKTFQNSNRNNLFNRPESKCYMEPQNVIGIPKVAYKHPGSNHIEWEDIHNRLFRERILFVSQPLDDNYVNQLIAAILCLDNETVEKPITLYINSPGGNMHAGLSLYDTLKHVRSDIVTINVGLCASTATLLLGAGTPGKRYGLCHSRVLLLQPSGLAEGTAEQIKVEAQHIVEIKKNLIEIYSNITKQPLEKIASDIERDNFMSAEEYKSYGLIDEIITNSSSNLLSK